MCFLTITLIFKIFSMADMVCRLVEANLTSMFSSCVGVICGGVLV